MQDHDLAVDRLRHRRRTIPEQAQLEALEGRAVAVERSLVDATGRRDEVARRQRRLEDELAVVELKKAEEQARLYSGTVSLIRELQALQAEIDALKRRAGSLEDEVLEAMTEREPLDQEVADLEAQSVAVDEQAAGLRVVVAAAQAAIDEELVVEEAARAAAVDGIAPAVISSYERLRTRLDGIGAARLVNGRCDGCHLSLSVTELTTANRQPPDALFHCEQCGRILVR